MGACESFGLACMLDVLRIFQGRGFEIKVLLSVILLPTIFFFFRRPLSVFYNELAIALWTTEHSDEEKVQFEKERQKRKVAWNNWFRRMFKARKSGAPRKKAKPKPRPKTQSVEEERYWTGKVKWADPEFRYLEQ